MQPDYQPGETLPHTILISLIVFSSNVVDQLPNIDGNGQADTSAWGGYIVDPSNPKWKEELRYVYMRAGMLNATSTLVVISKSSRVN